MINFEAINKLNYLILSNSKKIFVSLIWLSFFFSINLNPAEFYNFSLFNKIRISMPAVLIFFSLFIIKNINYKNLLRFDSILFILIFFLYIFFTILNKDNFLSNLFWPFYMFLAFFFTTSIIDENEKNFLIKLTVYILLIAFLFYFSFAIFDMFKNNTVNFYGVLGNNDSYGALKNPPRSSGLARLALILFSYFLIYYLIKNSENKKYYILLFLISLFAICTILFQSRTISFIFIVTNLLLIVFYFEKFINNKKIFLFIFIFPLIFNISYNYLKYQYNYKYHYDKSFKTYDSKIELLGYVAKNSIYREKSDRIGVNEENNQFNIYSFSSGRLYTWEKTLKIVKKNPFIGFGAQSDRLYLEQSVHNVYLYALLSGGIIATICIILIQLKILFLLINFYKKKFLKFDLNTCFSFMVTIIICQRSLLETSFGVFGIDYLLFILGYALITTKILRNN